MKSLEDYGRSTLDRVNYLVRDLSDDEKYNYFRLDSFVKIWAASVGGSCDINEHTAFFRRTEIYALRQIDAVFFKKFGLHIEEFPASLEMDETEWRDGITPCSRRPNN